METYNGITSAKVFSSISVTNADFEPQIGAGVIIYDQTDGKVKLSNNGGSFQPIESGSESTVIAGTNISVSSVGSDYTVSTVSNPSFTSATLSGLTVGKVPYIGTGGLLSVNSNFCWDNTNSRLGIGNTSPSTTLHVTGSTTLTGSLTVSSTVTVNSSLSATSSITTSSGLSAATRSLLASTTIGLAPAVLTNSATTTSAAEALVGEMYGSGTVTGSYATLRLGRANTNYFHARFLYGSATIADQSNRFEIGHVSTARLLSLTPTGILQLGSTDVAGAKVGIYGSSGSTIPVQIAGTDGTNATWKIGTMATGKVIFGVGSGQTLGFGTVANDSSTYSDFVTISSSLTTVTNQLKVSTYPILGGTSTSNSSSYFTNFLASMTAGDVKYVTFGNALSTGDQAEIGFSYAGTNNSSNRLVLGFYGNQVMHIMNGGNVGIGTSSPSYKLDVSGTSRFTDAMTIGTLYANGGGMTFSHPSTGSNNTTFTFANGSASSDAKIDLQPWSGGSNYLTFTQLASTGTNYVRAVINGTSATPFITITSTGGAKYDYLVLGTNGQAVAGGMRYNSGTLQYYDGSAWQTLGTSSAGSFTTLSVSGTSTLTGYATFGNGVGITGGATVSGTLGAANVNVSNTVTALALNSTGTIAASGNISSGNNITATNALSAPTVTTNYIGASSAAVIKVGDIPAFSALASESIASTWLASNTGVVGPNIGNGSSSGLGSGDWLWFFGRNGTTSRRYYQISSTAYFTGQHAGYCYVDSGCTIPIDNTNIMDYVGMIVVSTGVIKEPTLDGEGIVTGEAAIGICQALPVLALSSQANQKSVFGVISNINNWNNAQIDDTLEGWENGLYGMIRVNSLGEGGMWVISEYDESNGVAISPMENGDLICTSGVPGYGQKQSNSIMMSYTVAKVTMDCDFSMGTGKYRCEKINHQGITYRRAFIGCTYHCG